MLIELATCSNIVSTGENCEARTGEEEELLLNTVAACTNITFYACKVSSRASSVQFISSFLSLFLSFFHYFCYFFVFIFSSLSGSGKFSCYEETIPASYHRSFFLFLNQSLLFTDFLFFYFLLLFIYFFYFYFYLFINHIFF